MKVKRPKIARFKERPPSRRVNSARKCGQGIYSVHLVAAFQQPPNKVSTNKAGPASNNRNITHVTPMISEDEQGASLGAA